MFMRVVLLSQMIHVKVKCSCVMSCYLRCHMLNVMCVVLLSQMLHVKCLCVVSLSQMLHVKCLCVVLLSQMSHVKCYVCCPVISDVTC